MLYLKIFNIKSIQYKCFSIIRAKIKIIGKKSFFKIGNKCKIMSGSEIRVSNGRMYIGDNVEFKENTVLQANKGTIKIGNKVFINRNCSIISCDKIEIGDGTSLGGNILIYDHDHIYKRYGEQNWNNINKSSVIIGKNVWIGANTVILKGTRIGDNSVIAAGSVIKGEIPEHTLIYQKRNNVYRDII